MRAANLGMLKIKFDCRLGAMPKIFTNEICSGRAANCPSLELSSTRAFGIVVMCKRTSVH